MAHFILAAKAVHVIGFALWVGAMWSLHDHAMRAPPGAQGARSELPS